jgi:hypothetical protein
MLPVRNRRIRVSLYIFIAGLFVLRFPSKISFESTADESSISCFGASCELQNVCVATNGTILLYTANHENAKNITSEISKKPIRSAISGEVHLEVSRGGRQIEKRSLQRSAVFIDRYVAGNCGHILGDEIWPTFRLARKFRSLSEVQTHGVGDILLKSDSTIRCDQMFDALSHHKPKLLANPSLERELDCYQSVFFGVSGMSYVDGHSVGESTEYLKSAQFIQDMKDFREQFYSFERQSQVAVESTEVTLKAAFMVKKSGLHMSNIGNRGELMAVVKDCLPGLSVEEVSWADFYPVEQIHILKQTKVLISLPGSDVMNAVFLPDGSWLIVFCRIVDGNVEYSNEIALWFRYMRHLHVVEICGQHVTRMDSGSDVLVNASKLKEVLSSVKL